jgi:hypothetical protein
MIQVLGGDPSLRGVMQALTFGIGAAQARRVSPDALAGPMNMLSDMLDDLFAGRFPSFSWRSLMNGKPRLTSCGASSKSSRNSISVPWSLAARRSTRLGRRRTS